MASLKVQERAEDGIRWAVRAFCVTIPLTIAGANISWGLLLASLLALLAAGGKIPRDAWKSRAALPLLGFLAVSLLTAALGIDPGRSFKFIYQDVHKVWLYLLFMTALSRVQDPKAFRFLGLGFAIAALIGIGQSLPSHFAVLRFGLPDWDMKRAHAFVHAVTYGEQMAVAALGAVCFLIDPPEQSATAHKRGAAALLLLSLTALLLSGTRGALVAFFGGTCAVFAMLPRLRRYVLATAILGAGLFVLVELQNPGRSLLGQVIDIARVEDPYARPLLRLRLFRVAWQIGTDHPLTGVGLNNYRIALPQYLDMVFEDETKSWGTAHNLYLHHFAERGLLGLGALLILLWAFWKRSFDRARKLGDGLNLWAFGTTTAFLIMNLTEVALQVEVIWMLIFFVWILSETSYRASKMETP